MKGKIGGLKKKKGKKKEKKENLENLDKIDLSQVWSPQTITDPLGPSRTWGSGTNSATSNLFARTIHHTLGMRYLMTHLALRPEVGLCILVPSSSGV